jgi:hypothetical protein
MPEPETGRQRSEQRTGIVKEAWYLAPHARGDQLASGANQAVSGYWHLTAGAAPMHPDHALAQPQPTADPATH